MKRVTTLGACATSVALVVSLWASVSAADAVANPVEIVSASAMGTTSSTSVAVAAADSAAKKDKSKKKAKKWTAYKGPFFNNPHLPKDRYRLERRLVDTLRHVPKGEPVRIAIYSFDRIPVANAIVAAHKRGVRIQMLLNDHWENRALKIVRASLGTNRSAKSFIYKCKSGCRTLVDQYRNLHTKFYTFTKAGKSKDVLVVGSVNLTRNAAAHQWNDAFFMSGNEALFDQFTALFKDMKKDYSKTQPSYLFCGVPVNGQTCDDSQDKITNYVFPKRSTPSDDQVLKMLGKITCLTPDGAGARSAPSSRCRCTRCVVSGATTWPTRSDASGPRAATSGSATA